MHCPRVCTDIPFERHEEVYADYGPEPYIDITYTVRLQRRPLYYVIYMILPTAVMSFMSLLAFLLPSDTGEKIGLGLLIIHSFIQSVSQWRIHEWALTPARPFGVRKKQVFLTCDSLTAHVIAIGWTSVGPSVCLSHAGIVSKRSTYCQITVFTAW